MSLTKRSSFRSFESSDSDKSEWTTNDSIAGSDAEGAGNMDGIKRVLVVDDNESIRILHGLILAQAGYVVETAADGEEGWEALRSSSYDLLVTDNDMPRLRGIELVERLRIFGMNLPVVVVSGMDLQEYIQNRKYQSLQIAAVLSKASNPAELLEVAGRLAPITRKNAKPILSSWSIGQKNHGRSTTEEDPMNSYAIPEGGMAFDHRDTDADSSSSNAARESKCVLIVDDDAVVRSSVGEVLECEGYEVYGAGDGQAAIKSAIEHKPDLILLDLNMPIMDGWRAFVELEHARPLTPVIVITARPHQYKQAVNLGVDALMEKPLNFPVLLEAIHKFTHESQERHTRRITNPGFATVLLDDQSLNCFGKTLDTWHTNDLPGTQG